MWGGNRLWMITCGWICELNSVGRPLFFHFKSKQKLFPDRYVFILIFQKSLFRIRVVFLLQLKLSLLYLSRDIWCLISATFWWFLCMMSISWFWTCGCLSSTVDLTKIISLVYLLTKSKLFGGENSALRVWD